MIHLAKATWHSVHYKRTWTCDENHLLVGPQGVHFLGGSIALCEVWLLASGMEPTLRALEPLPDGWAGGCVPIGIKVGFAATEGACFVAKANILTRASSFCCTVTSHGDGGYWNGCASGFMAVLTGIVAARTNVVVGGVGRRAGVLTGRGWVALRTGGSRLTSGTAGTILFRRLRGCMPSAQSGNRVAVQAHPAARLGLLDIATLNVEVRWRCCDVGDDVRRAKQRMRKSRTYIPVYAGLGDASCPCKTLVAMHPVHLQR